MATLPVKVTRIEQVTPRIRHFTLEALQDTPLPAFSGGSHIVVSLSDGQRAIRNAYSLLNDPADPGSYQIAVRIQENSRGGSRRLHEQVAVGDVLEVSPPANLFPLSSRARRHLLIAGGVGITPFMSQMHDLKRAGADFELHYAARGLDHAAFAEQLVIDHPGRVWLYPGDQGERLNLAGLLSAQPLGTHVYVCGPQGLNEAVQKTAAACGWPASHVHVEAFAAPTSGAPYTVALAKSGRDIRVGAEESLLEALEAAGVAAPNMCRGGVCGVCETRVLAGEIAHHDQYLTDADKAAHDRMMICVSRAACERIVIDL